MLRRRAQAGQDRIKTSCTCLLVLQPLQLLPDFVQLLLQLLTLHD
jgi:hypothetical protein